jgi:hypothetical protein
VMLDECSRALVMRMESQQIAGLLSDLGVVAVAQHEAMIGTTSTREKVSSTNATEARSLLFSRRVGNPSVPCCSRG